MWLSPLNVPCISPPWGYVAATDLRTGNVLWAQPLVTYMHNGRQYVAVAAGGHARLETKVGDSIVVFALAP